MERKLPKKGMKTLGKSRGGPKVHPEGRRCADPWCDVLLSIYNKNDFCALHYRGRRPRIRAKPRMAEDELKPLPECEACRKRLGFFGQDVERVEIDGVIHIDYQGNPDGTICGLP